MQIRVGCELIYECPQPTPMILMLNSHFSRAFDLVVPDRLVTVPSLPISAYRDSFGNWCSRIVAPAGETRIATDALINDSGLPDVVAAGATQTPVESLPEETLIFLLGSRYCETERLSTIAWQLFGNAPPSDGAAFRPFAISSIAASSSGITTRGRRGRPGKPTWTRPVSAAISLTWPSRSAAA